GFYADVVADVLSLPACPNQQTAYSVLEALRMAATSVLDMHMEDLQILVIGHVDRDEVDGLLWDPMAGGSGLIDQICEHFDEVVPNAVAIVESCPSACDTSCVDCLQTFRNGYYHKHLDRTTARDGLKSWGPRLSMSHEIPAKQPSKEPSGGAYPVNEAEQKLRHLLKAAGFEEGFRGEQLRLDRAIGTTTPDVIYRSTHHDDDEGVCIYLDGLSNHIHGNTKTAEKDQRIRTWLRNNGYEVIEIAVSDLDDQGAMIRHFRRLAGYLRADDIRNSIKDDTSWFGRAEKKTRLETRSVYRLVHPKSENYFSTCVPLVPLKFAAGAFSDPQHFDHDSWEWVEIDTHRRIRPGMFVAQVVGKSMEPLIPDKSYCLFSTPVTGTRQDRTVVVQLSDEVDPETGERYTVKIYKSEKIASDDGGWRHLKIILKPRNPDFTPIELTCEDEGKIEVVAEFLEVLG
ncbi:MAG: DUF1998 domain-containing protein, partial [Desulfosarcina sp.]|nr:DUF1998 domain-containing protein [Desulfosarcina sp.]